MRLVRRRRQAILQSPTEGASDTEPAPSPVEETRLDGEAVGPENTDVPSDDVRASTAGQLQVAFRRTDRVLILGDVETGKTFLAGKIVASAPRRIILTPHHDDWTDEPNRIIVTTPEQLLDGVGKALELGNLVCVIDDMDILVKKTEKDPRMNLLLMGPRHRGIGWVMISRRTADLPTLVFSTANKVFIFQTDLPQDLETFREFYNCAEAVQGLNRLQHQTLFIDRETKKRQVIVAV